MAVFNTFTFDGENSLNYGVYITGEAVYNAPERAVEMVSIPGKNGALALDQGRFENIEVTYPAGTFGVEQTEFAGRMRALRNMLASRYNYVRLTDSYHPDEYRLGLYKSGLEASPVAMSSAGEFDITFNCKPQRFLTSGEEPVDTSELGGDVTTDKVPYLFRRSGGGNIGYDFDAEIDKIIGGTVAWNQLVKNGNFADTSNWGTTNSCVINSVSSNTINFTTIDAFNSGISQNGIPMTNGHKYLLLATVKTDTRVWASIDGVGATAFSENSFVTKGSIFGWSDPTGLSPFKIRKQSADGVANVQARNCMLTDLTALFGSAEIADYVYSLEQTTAGAGVAWLKSHGFLTKDYYAYDSGSLQSVKTSAHVMRDENDVVIATYPLDSDLELRGLFKLDANNNLYAEGDVYESSGAVTRKYGIIDLGTLTWYWAGDRGYAPSRIMGLVPWKTYAPMICEKFTVVTDYDMTYGVNGLSFYRDALDQDGYFKLRDPSLTTLAELQTAVSGVYLVYELATPTTEQADPYQRIQIVDNNGTEEYVDSRSVPIPVGHETKYGMSQLVLTNPTEFPSKPLLEVTGVGTFWLGDTLFTITGTAGQTIYIDCETGEAWKNVGGVITPANGLVTLNRLDFPELDPGDNPVMYGAGITKVVVTPRWWRL